MYLSKTKIEGYFMNLTKLAREAGMCKSKMSYIFNGKQCSEEDAKRIANVLNCKLEDIEEKRER